VEKWRAVFLQMGPSQGYQRRAKGQYSCQAHVVWVQGQCGCSFRFVSFRFVSFRFVSFRFVSFH
jgi:hypothetical protein